MTEESQKRIQELEEALRAIKNDARLIRSLAHDDTPIANLATGVYVGARTALKEKT